MSIRGSAPHPGGPGATTPPAAGVRCPSCAGADLVVEPAAAGAGPVNTAVAACPQCGHRASAALVAELVYLEGERARLQARLDWVRQRVAAGDLVASTGWSAPAPPAPRVARPALTAQALLLIVGAVLLVAAAVVFAAVAWNRIGPWGQVVLMVVVVGVLAAGAHLLRRTYRATGEALAAVAVAVAAVALVAAPRLGLGADWMRRRELAWAAIALLLTALFAAAMDRLAGAVRLLAWRVGLVAALAGAGVAACLAPGEGTAGRALALAVLAVAGYAVLIMLSRTARRPPPETWWVGGLLTGLAAQQALGGPQEELVWAVPWAVHAVGLGVLASTRTGWPAGRWPGRTPRRQGLALLWGLAAAEVIVRVAASVGRPGARLVALAVAGSVALVVTRAWRRSRRRAGLRGGRPGGRTVATGGAAVAVAVWVLSLSLLDRVSAGEVSLALVAVAVGVLAAAVLDRSVVLPFVAAGAGSLAWWIWLGRNGFDTLEGYTLPAAALTLGAGVLAGVHLVRHWHPDGAVPGPRAEVHRVAALSLAPTILVAGPALALALLPSAVASWPGGGASSGRPLRLVLVLSAAALLTVVGAFLRWQAPALLGALALLIVALGQLARVVDVVPGWVSLSVVGVALLVAGFSAEKLAREARGVARAVADFH